LEADVRLFAVPLDIANAAGTWSYEDNVLSLNQAQFRLLDRNNPQRFEPLTARGATLSLADSIIIAQVNLRHPASDRVVTRADIRHNLSNSTGHADLAVDELRFDEDLQPEDLSVLAKGVIALADGVITGSGRIDWNDAGITSSGRISSDRLDFAAAFGPVQGAYGTVEFTDLLNLTTAPDQKVHIGSINPGIEVLDGEAVAENLHVPRTVYKPGKVVRSKNGYSDDFTIDCAPGIHFFLTEKEAREW